MKGLQTFHLPNSFLQMWSSRSVLGSPLYYKLLVTLILLLPIYWWILWSLVVLVPEDMKGNLVTKNSQLIIFCIIFEKLWFIQSQRVQDYFYGSNIHNSVNNSILTTILICFLEIPASFWAMHSYVPASSGFMLLKRMVSFVWVQLTVLFAGL